MKLSERLEARAAFEDNRVLDEAKAMGFVPDVYTGSQTGALLREAAELARSVEWQPVPPAKAGRYIVAAEGLEAREARWQPKKGRWTFPSAQTAFTPTHYMPMPQIVPEAGQEVPDGGR